jgi:tetratricopeptide (TPR) repeat protein
VDSTGIKRAAAELLECGHYPSVVAVCSGALAENPDDVELRLLLARALVFLREDSKAEKHLGGVLQRDCTCATAYQLLGEIALRRDDPGSAEIFFREALRLEPRNTAARDWLTVVLSLRSPGAAAANFPAAAVAPGTSGSQDRGRISGTDWGQRRTRRRLGRSSEPEIETTRKTPGQAVRTRGFGRYLVEMGLLSPMELVRTLGYHRSRGVRVGEAAVALGYLSTRKVEWAATHYHNRRSSTRGY